MNRTEITDRISKMLGMTRNLAGKSQADMAKALGVSKGMIQKWEDGITPIQLIRVFEWFNAIDVPPAPFVWGLIHGSLDGITAEDDDERITEALIDYVKSMSIDHQRKLLYVLYGDHGSNAGAQLELMVAYNHLAMREKIDVANVIRLDYNIALDSGEVNNEHVLPDTNLLDTALQAAYKAVTNSKKSYTISGVKNEH